MIQQETLLTSLAKIRSVRSAVAATFGNPKASLDELHSAVESIAASQRQLAADRASLEEARAYARLAVDDEELATIIDKLREIDLAGEQFAALSQALAPRLKVAERASSEQDELEKTRKAAADMTTGLDAYVVGLDALIGGIEEALQALATADRLFADRLLASHRLDMPALAVDYSDQYLEIETRLSSLCIRISAALDLGSKRRR